MQVWQLMERLAQQNPEATVVVCDRTDFSRSGLLRPLAPEEFRTVQLGECSEGGAPWVCAWRERTVDSNAPQPGVLLGPP